MLRSPVIPRLLAISLCALGTTIATSASASKRDATQIGDFSFAAPKGWRLRPVTERDHLYLDDPAHAHILEPVRRSNPQCPIVLHKETASSPAAAQTLRAVRMRSGVLDARENEIRRSELRSLSGLPIRKADFSTSRSVLPIHTILYSFRAADGRVYTLSCWVPRGHEEDFERVLEELARSISA